MLAQKKKKNFDWSHSFTQHWFVVLMLFSSRIRDFLFSPGWCFLLVFCNCALIERRCSPLEYTHTSSLLTLHMCLQCFFSITYHSVPSCDCNPFVSRCVFATENQQFVYAFIQLCCLIMHLRGFCIFYGTRITGARV